eukprot:438837-Pleurochrysis_carterae.AAC.1
MREPGSPLRQVGDKLSLVKAAHVQHAQSGQKASPKERGVRQGGGSDWAVEEGIGHGELSPRKEGF